jgi:hypothetical protein
MKVGENRRQPLAARSGSMHRRLFLAVLIMIAGVAGCSQATVQPPQGTPQPPNSSSNTPAPPPQVTGSQRMQHAWNKAMEGIAMGGALGGPYGAGGGLVIGLIAGLLTADSHYTALNNQIYTEQQKDRQLEAAIEQELARQRELESQIAKAETAGSGATADEPKKEPTAAPQAPSAKTQENAPGNQAQANISLASLNKPMANQPQPAPFKNVEIKDINGDGIADLWIYYHPQRPTEIMRQEEASKGDGRVDTWSYFNLGHLVRREVDTKGQGHPDAVYYYANEKIVREERDESGLGRMTYRATYESGRLAKVERDTGGSGRSDLWIYYDPSKDGEVVVKEEKDLNGDGTVDLWTYYENGRLARRDTNLIGLEILSKQEQLPVFTADVRSPPAPGS